MNSKIKILLIGLLEAVAVFFVTKQFFPNQIEDNTIDVSLVADSVALIRIAQDSIIIDSLEAELVKKPKVKVEVRYVPKPFPVVIKKDSIIYKDKPYPVIKTITLRDTIRIENTIDPLDFDYAYEYYIIGKSNSTKVKLNKKEVKKEDIIYLYDGDNREKSLVTFYGKESIKRKIKFNTPSIYALLVSSNEDINDRADKIIKNSNKF